MGEGGERGPGVPPVNRAPARGLTVSGGLGGCGLGEGGVAPGARSNYGHWDDPTFSALLDQAASANGEGAQAAAYARVEARIDDQAPLIPWAYDVSSWLVRPGLNGLGSLTVGLLDFGLVSWSS